MPYIERELVPVLNQAARSFPAVVLTGPRGAGKTTLLRHTFPHADYRLLEDPGVVAVAREDPGGFLDDLKLPAILDEIQSVPELLNFIRARIDQGRKRHGQWLLTGSQDFALMKGITESMAGRAATLQLLPLSTAETEKVTVLRGGYPEILARPRNAGIWFQSYVQTYLERDVRQISQIRDLSTFRRCLALVATRSGQILNKTDLAAPLGVSVPTVTEWLSILESTGQVILVPPYYENFGKRLIKSPKLYLTDSGLAGYILGLETQRDLERSPFRGPLFEGFIAAEIVKQQVNQGKRRELYYFRDQRGLEVDFLVPLRGRKLAMIEAKAARTVYPDAARNLRALAGSAHALRPEGMIVHITKGGDSENRPLAPGVRALSADQMLSLLRR